MAVDRLDLSALTLYREIRCRLLQVSDPGVEMFVRDTALLRLVFGHDAKVRWLSHRQPVQLRTKQCVKWRCV